MSHRLRKRIEDKESPQFGDNKQINTKSYTPELLNTKSNKLPRPYHSSLTQLPIFEKIQFRKGLLAFPPPDSIYQSTNTYDAGPQFCRPTSAVMESGARKYNFPLGVWIMPFGSPQVHTVKIQSPLRCQRCKAYINPYFKHDGGSKTSTCNICGIRFNIPQQIDKNNLYATQISTQGVIDFIVSDKFYMRKKMDIIKVIIAIEMSMPMIETGVFATIIECIKSSVQNNEFEPNLRFGIVYYNDEGVTFIKKSKSQLNTQTETIYQHTEFLVNTKVGSFCCPLSDQQFLYNLNEQGQRGSFLSLISSIHQNANVFYQKGKHANLANYVAALKCISESFEDQTGRVILFSTLDPKQPPCALRVRNQEQLKNPLKQMSEEYAEVAKQLVKNRIGVDHYLFSKEANICHELATTHFISSLTGGNIFLYSSYIPENHSQHLYYSIYKTITKQYVYDVDYTCRVSNGLSVGEFIVADGPKQVRDIGVSMMDPSHSIAVTFTHEQKIEGGAYLQFAMMYTTGKGERRIRTINYKYKLSERLELIHQASDYTAFANILSRLYVSKLKNNDPIKVREEALGKIISIIQEYRIECPSTVKYNELPIHSNLSNALCYLHSIFNSKIFLNSYKLSPDFRLSQITKINTYGFYLFAMRYYPHLYPLTTDIYDHQPLPGDFLPTNEEIAILPPNLPLTATSIREDGVYLYYTGDYIIIIVMPQASEQLLVDLFGTNDWQQIQENGLPQLETSHNIRVQNIISELRRRTTQNNGLYPPLLVRTVLKKGPFNDLVTSIYKEDYSGYNYFTFLDSLNRAIQTKTK